MSQSVLFFIIVLVIVFAIMVSSYIHKRHHEFNMDDIVLSWKKLTGYKST